MSADFDFDTLWEDYDTVVALESRGAGMDNPMMRAIAQRWCLLDEMEQQVAHESRAMMERAQIVADGAADGRIAKKIAKDAARATGRVVGATAKLAGKGAAKAGRAAGRGAGKLSVALGNKFKEWAAHYGPIFKEKLADMTSKATLLENRRQKVEKHLQAKDTLSTAPLTAGMWVSKICFEDKVSLEECLKLASQSQAMDAAVKQYTVNVRQFEGLLVHRYKNEDGVLSKIGYPSNAAIHRASGILGRFTEKDVQARPLAGNVIIVNHGRAPKEKVEFAVAREAKLSNELEPLNKAECQKALGAVKTIAATLRDRGVKRGVFSYSGIYAEMEQMQQQMESLEGEELRSAMLYYKNAMALEDAFTTALARVGDGLLNWVTASVKAG